MKFIINPLNGTKHSLFSKQGKNLLKSYVKTYQTGGDMVNPFLDDNVDNTTASAVTESDKTSTSEDTSDDPSINIDSSKLHILGCIGEILQFDEAENKTGRMIGKSTKPIASLSEQCSYRTLSEEGKYPLMPDKTRTRLQETCNDSKQGGALVYHSHKGICLNADAGLGDRNASKLKKQIWKDIFESLLDIFKGMKKENRKGAHVVIVSHHNLIKKVLLGIPKEKGIANCACIEIRINRQQPQEKAKAQTNPNSEPNHQGDDGSIVDYTQVVKTGGAGVKMRTRGKTKLISFNFIFSGYPDKKKYKYLNKLNTESKGPHWEEVDTTNIENGLRDTKGLPNNFSIYLVRHGNAMHNKPMMDILQKKNLGYRPLDSSLTLLGLWQAKQLGKALNKYLENVDKKNIIYCASNLSRAQATALAIKEQVDEFIGATRLKEHYERKKKESLERMTRRLKINSRNQDEIIKKLAESLKEMLKGHSELQKSLPSEVIKTEKKTEKEQQEDMSEQLDNFKLMAEKMLGGFVFSQTAQELKKQQDQKRKKGESQHKREMNKAEGDYTENRRKQYEDAAAAEAADKLARSVDNVELPTKQEGIDASTIDLMLSDSVDTSNII